MAKILARKNAEKLCDNFASEESSDSEVGAFSRLKKNMAAQKSEASSNKKGKRRYLKIKNKCIWQASSSTGKREGQEFQRLQRGLHVLQRNSGPKLLIHSFKTKRFSQRFSKIYHSKLFVKLLRNVTTICTPSANLFWLNKPLKKLGNTKETTKGSSYFSFFFCFQTFC